MPTKVFAVLLVLTCLSPAVAQEVCRYEDRDGSVQTAASRNDIPYAFRRKARCYSTSLARPEEIELQGNIRREDISTSLGRVQLRWPRSVEPLFGRTPLRAVTDAATTVSRAIRTAAFPSEVQSLNVQWQIVFMDENLPDSQVPYHLVSNCHPGWMTPPGNIYIVAQRVAEQCGGRKAPSAGVADSDLTEVLVHEMGHAVEFHLLKDRFVGDRMRAEGFATWFEIHAAQYSALMSQRQLRDSTFARAAAAIQQSPNAFVFTGSSFDYARASMYFSAIVDRRGIRGLMDVYDLMRREPVTLLPAIERTLDWRHEELEREARRLLSK